MRLNTQIICQIIILICINSALVDSFSNFFSEIFDDLRIGSLDKDYLSQKLGNDRLKCAEGSHFFNGSCYFISNKKYMDTSSSLFDTDLSVLDYLNKKTQKARLTVSNLQLSQISSSLPIENTWRSAVNSCANLHNDSSLIYLENDREYKFLVGLLTELHFPNLFVGNKLESRLYNEEQKYYIGLTYNNSIWQWLGGSRLSTEMIQRFSLERIKYDNYRKCAYLNLRDNGDVKIELTNCNNERHPYICKYVMDRCFNNTSCGLNGECVNVPSKKSFECRCRIFYDGEKCERWSTQGVQMLITVGLVALAFAIILVMNIMNCITFKCLKKQKPKNTSHFSSEYINYGHSTLNPLLPETYKHLSVIKTQLNPFRSVVNMFKKKLRLSLLVVTSLATALVFIFSVSMIRAKMIEFKIEQYQRQLSGNRTESVQAHQPSRLGIILSYDVCKLINDQFFEDYMLIFVSFPITMLIYVWNAFKCRDHDYDCRFGSLKLKRENRKKISGYNENCRPVSALSSIENASFTDPKLSKASQPAKVSRASRLSTIPISLCYTCSVLCKRLNLSKLTICGFMCSCSFKMPVPVNPFSKRNRFITAIIYAAYTYNILKIFEYLIVGDKHIQEGSRMLEHAKLLQNHTIKNLTSVARNKLDNMIERGILMDLLKQICNVIIIGLRYYPVLLCVELKRKSKLCYFVTSLYVLLLFFSYIYMNIFCLLAASNAIKDVTKQYEGGIREGLGLPIDESAFKTEESSQLNAYRMITSTTPIGLLIGRGQNRLPDRTEDLHRDELITRSYFEMNKQISGITINLNRPNFQILDKLLIYNDRSNKTPGKTQTWSQQLTFINTSHLESFKRTLFIDNIMYEKFLFYAVLCLITFNITFEFGRLVKQSICGPKPSITNEVIVSGSKHTLKFTREILYGSNKPISFTRHLFEKFIYKNRADFRFPKQFINTQIIAFVLLYYITCIIVRKSTLIVNLSSNVMILFINFIFQSAGGGNDASSFAMSSREQLNLIVKSLFDHIATDIIVACCLTSGIYILQLFLGIRNYQRHVLNAYKGVYVEIPAPKNFSHTKTASSSLHYSGYAIGYLLWGYLILFEVIVVLTVVVKFLAKFYFITENLAKVILPIICIFLFKRIIIWYLSRFFLTSSGNKGFLLRNPKLYFILSHFNFFFDCFLGSFVCFMRMAKSSLAALFFMPRLDYSIFGRYLERTDMGFISYVTFIHMDVNQSHPIKSAFCQLLLLGQAKPQMNKTARNKWLVAITLARNPGLKKQRKNYLSYMRKVQKVETFEQFLERRVKVLFGTETSRKRSRSTPNLLASKRSKNAGQKVFKSMGDEIGYVQEATAIVKYRVDQNNNHIYSQQTAQYKRQIFAGHYENEHFGEELMNSTVSTNDTTILNYSGEYSPRSNMA